MIYARGVEDLLCNPRYRGFRTSSSFGENRCWGRHDSVWELHSVDGLGRTFNDSFCGRRVEPGSLPSGGGSEGGLPPSSALRAYAHVSKLAGAPGVSSTKAVRVTYALANLWRNRSLTARLQSAGSIVQYVLSSSTPGDDMAMLNGKPLAVSQPGDVLPSLHGEPVSGGTVTLPPRAVAFVTAAVQVAVPFKSLTIVVPPNRGPLNKTAGILSRVIRSKSGNCSVRIAPDRPTAGLSLTLKIENSLGPEAFAATYDGANEAIIAGGDRMGVLFGAGAFLRASQFRSTGFVPPQSSALGSPWEAKDAPKTPGSFRAIYMASHFGNYFVNAPLNEVYEYLEDVALWGANSLVITGADAGRLANLSQAMPILTRNVKIGIHAKLLGMRVGSMFTNEGFTSQPPGIAYTSPAGVGDKGDFGPFMHLVCPAKGLGYLKDHVYGPIFGNISSLGLSLDYIIAWRKKASIRLLIRQRLSPSR